MPRARLPHFLWPARWLPAVRNAGRFPMNVPGCNRTYRNSTLALHLHEYAGTVWIAGTAIRLQPGDLTLSPPQDDSSYDLRESGTHLCIHFEPAAGARRARGPELRVPLHFRPGAQVAAARERFWRVTDYFRQAGGRSEGAAGAAASAAMQELILWLHLQGFSKTVSVRRGRAEEALAELRGLIDRSLARVLTVPDLARQTGLSADYLARLFRRRHGMTIPHYLLLRRMELARHLLRSTSLPIREIGRQTGIPDPQYFNKQFRRVAGQSPSVYRARAVRPRSSASARAARRAGAARRAAG